MKWFIICVFPGFVEILANPFVWDITLIKEDFPTLERPIKAYSGLSGLGHFR